MNWLLKLIGYPQNLAIGNNKGEILTIRKKSISFIKLYPSNMLPKTWYIGIWVKDEQIFEAKFDNRESALDKLAELEALVY